MASAAGALRHGAEHVLAPHHAGVEEREAGQRHHEDEGGRDDHEAGVGGVDARLGGHRRAREAGQRQK